MLNIFANVNTESLVCKQVGADKSKGF